MRLYEKGLVYRGHYIINWCPRCLTALSNEEAEKEEVEGKLWHLRYPLAAAAATSPWPPPAPRRCWAIPASRCTRRTSATAISSARDVLLPLVDRRVPIVADDAVDPAFGTGAVKMTPAHDPTDFEIGRRHGLPASTSSPRRPASAGRARSDFRAWTASRPARVVAEFETLGLLEQVEPHRHAVGHCYRCDTVIEPRLSDQWFVRMAPLAAPALAAYRDGTPALHSRAAGGGVPGLARGHP